MRRKGAIGRSSKRGLEHAVEEGEALGSHHRGWNRRQSRHRCWHGEGQGREAWRQLRRQLIALHRKGGVRVRHGATGPIKIRRARGCVMVRISKWPAAKALQACLSPPLLRRRACYGATVSAGWQMAGKGRRFRGAAGGGAGLHEGRARARNLTPAHRICD